MRSPWTERRLVPADTNQLSTAAAQSTLVRDRVGRIASVLGMDRFKRMKGSDDEKKHHHDCGYHDCVLLVEY